MIHWHATHLVNGHGVASGQAKDSPYPLGSIKMQTPIFKRLGLDLQDCWPGTLNLSFSPFEVHLQNPDHHFQSIHWTELHPPETFSFWRVHLRENHHCKFLLKGWIYQPHPETKIRNQQPESVIEVIAPRIDGLEVGMGIEIGFKPDQLHWIN